MQKPDQRIRETNRRTRSKREASEGKCLIKSPASTAFPTATPRPDVGWMWRPRAHGAQAPFVWLVGRAWTPHAPHRLVSMRGLSGSGDSGLRDACARRLCAVDGRIEAGWGGICGDLDLRRSRRGTRGWSNEGFIFGPGARAGGVGFVMAVGFGLGGGCDGFRVADARVCQQVGRSWLHMRLDFQV